MSMSEVAEAIGVARATLYRYFPNRQALLDAIGAHAIEELRQLVSEAGDSELSMRESLSRIARAVMVKAGVALMLIREPEVMDRSIVEERFVAQVDMMVRKAQDAGLCSNELSSRAITLMFLGLLRSGIVLVAEGSRTAEEAAADVVRVFFDGVEVNH